MLKDLFNSRRPHREIPMKQLDDIFQFSGDEYEQKDETIFDTILYHLGTRGPTPKTSVRAFGFELSPDKIITLNLADHDHDFPASGGIYYSLHREMLKNVFSMIIREEIARESDYLDHQICFGIHGHYGKDNIMEIQSLLIPQYLKDRNGLPITRAIPVPVTRENIELALQYAEKCGRQIINWQHFTPWVNYDELVANSTQKPKTPEP